MPYPIHKLPPYSVQEVIVALSETVDWSLSLYGVPDQWQRSKGAGVRVAVLDTGIDASHPDLATAIDDARDFTRSRVGPIDMNGHGTHTAGTIGARQNAIGVVGVAPECRLLVGKVLGDSGSGDGVGVAAGIDWAADSGADVISMSLGSPASDERIALAIERAVNKGVFVIAAAGNTGRQDDVNFPARWKGRPNLARDSIAVAAVDREGRVARFSSRGPEVDIAAPGVDITSTYKGGGYAKLSGTSMATPFVAGVVALTVAIHRETLNPKTPLRTMAQLREHLSRTARDAGKIGQDNEYGSGLIDPGSMLARSDGGDGQSPLISFAGVEIYAPARSGDLVSLDINAANDQG